MIDRRDLLELANSLGLRPGVVEKDYVLGWLLAGVYHDPVLAPHWVFKGGTCLRKCYFETYRFSEDLDFTITEESHFDEKFLRERFAAIGGWLEEETGIELPLHLMRFEIFSNSRKKPAGEGRIGYRGPIAPRSGDLPRIKLDLTLDETIVRPPIIRPVAHPYADATEVRFEAKCYSYAEVFGEKIRALGERARPRDLYDVVNLFRHGEFRAAAAAEIRHVVRQKSAFKGLPVATLDALHRFKAELEADWPRMLAHQLPQLPPLDTFWSVLPEFFGWLEHDLEPAQSVGYPVAAGQTVIRGPAGGLPIPHQASSLVEVVRFAASNHLCVEIDYVERAGAPSQRTVEPYSLRSTADDHFVLIVYDLSRNDCRSFRLDHIRGARVSNRAFVPRYTIELIPTGPRAVP